MRDTPPAYVAFLWHMHQPNYRDPHTGDFVLPFVRLHGVKGYYDIIRLAEEYPRMRVTVNLVPSLIEQINQYARSSARDLYGDLSLIDPGDLSETQRYFIIRNFFMNRWETHVRPHPRYRELLVLRGNNPMREDPQTVVSRFSDRDILDLQTWFNLSWCGYFARADYPEITRLLEKGKDFTTDDKSAVIDVHQCIMERLLGLYKSAADDGRVELSTSPQYHPILPLLVDTESARRAIPGVELPGRFAHPEDADLQIRRGRALFEETFGFSPRGMWPPEGSVSPEVIPLAVDNGFAWMATDQDILFHSECQGTGNEKDIYLAHRAAHDGREIGVVFRDRNLSDLVGFSYAQSPPEAAAEDFLRRVENIAREKRKHPSLVAVVLDGENPWEGYMDGGEAFLRTVYGRLSDGNHSSAGSITIGEYVSSYSPHSRIAPLFSGSWINHSFGIWIGHPEENRAWDLVSLVRTYLKDKEREGAPKDALDVAWERLLAAEGSDWFWWFGDDFHSDTEEEFDALFRGYLAGVFEAFGEDPPVLLSIPIKRTSRPLEISQPLGFIHPDINGRVNDYYEWVNAGFYEVGFGSGSMYGGAEVVGGLYFGFSLENFYFRMDPVNDDVFDGSLRAYVIIRGKRTYRAVFPLVRGADEYTLSVYDTASTSRDIEVRRGVSIDRVVEMEIPFRSMDLESGDRFTFSVEVRTDGVTICRCPRRGFLQTEAPGEDFERLNWSV
ncbi:MAG: hypothetical protein JW885_08725 [Deltaproteobacteria bacterium]|nr:hypothetical protein [Candidatus Zymogenaceae bacterium]